MNTINPYNRLGGVRNNTATGRSGEGKPTQSGQLSQTDSVSLSNTAEQLSKVQARLDETPAIDRAKVDAIKAAITRGEYRVNAERVAEQLIALEKERLA